MEEQKKDNRGGAGRGQGRKPDDPEAGKKEPGTWALAADVMRIIKSKSKQAAWLEKAVRNQDARDRKKKMPSDD